MTSYHEYKSGNKIIYGWGSYKYNGGIAWFLGPFSKEIPQ